LAAGIEARRLEMDRQQQESQAQLDELRAELNTQSEVVHQRQAELVDKETQHRRQFEQLQAMGKDVAGQRKALAQESAAAALEHQQNLDVLAEARTEFVTLRKEAGQLQAQLPDLELHAGTTLERLTHAREQLRDHLAELHAYVHACQDDLDQIR